MTVTTNSWIEANQRALTAALERVRAALEQHIAHARGEPVCGEPEQPPVAAEDVPGTSALETLCATFGLSPFERDLLLLCAGVELDSGFAALCAAAQGDARRSGPTFSLALAALPAAHWSALTPAAPLRRWRLIEIEAGAALTTSPLRIDERILHFLAGAPYLDERLRGYVEPLPCSAALPPSHAALARRIAAIWSRPDAAGGCPVIQLCGAQGIGKRAVAAAACAGLGLQLHTMRAADVPAAVVEREALARLWEREAALGGSALLLDCDDLDLVADARAPAAFIESLRGLLLVVSPEPLRLRRSLLRIDVALPAAEEQRAAWHEALGQAAVNLDGQIDELVSQFNLSATQIRAVCAQLADRQEAAGAPASCLPPAVSYLWEACRAQARPRLDDLAQRITPAAVWDDLVLPEVQRQILREIAANVRRRAMVYEQWGFAAKSARGLGISALFAGPSGTGKTMAAEVLAGALRLDLYRIDLSQVVSKYIGETEKNLRRVFDAAEAGGAILLFDEADALFGKRSEVKDSHDRYANIEVSYLLQRMEQYRGLAILTTNMKSALDPAFLRRIRFVVQFPFPDPAQRAEIWRRVFPGDTPTAGLDVEKLARLNVTGGNIRNIALGAAFLAADEGAPVRMAHLLRAARSECAKLERPLTDAEAAGWG